MKKNDWLYLSSLRWMLLKDCAVLKSAFLLLVLMAFQLFSPAFGQSKKITIDVKDKPVEEIIKHVRTISGYRFLYNHEELKVAGNKTVKFSEASIEEVMREILKGTNLTFKVEKDVIVISPLKPTTRLQKLDSSRVTITGVVQTEDRMPIPGATIVLKGTSMGVASDKEGKFSIVISLKDTLQPLEVTFVGMEKKEVKIINAGKVSIKPLLIVLKEVEAKLDEVIVTGFQSIRKSEMVGSTNVVRREDLFFDGTNSIEQMLQGKLTGVLVTNASGLVGSRQKVRVRGTSTLLGNQEPVWVVDNIIQSDPLPFKTRELDAVGGSITEDNFDMVRNFVGNAVAWLSPNDIESIRVLKDATATAMYGVKAANGVIVITTKRGAAGKMSVNYGLSMSVSSKITYDKMNLMNSKERIDVSREIYERRLIGLKPLESIGYEGLLGSLLDKRISYGEFVSGVKRLETVNTDWFDLLYQNPFSHNHNLSVSGGTENLSYRASVSAQFVNGTARGNDSESYNGLVRVDATLHERVTLGVTFKGATQTTNAFNKVDPYEYASTTSRAIPCFNEDGSRFFYETQKGAEKSKPMYNVLNELEQTGNVNTNQSYGIQANLRYMIWEGLSYTMDFGLSYSNMHGESYASELSAYITSMRGYEFGMYRPTDANYKMSELPHGGELNTTGSRNRSYTWKNTLAFDRTFAERHRVNVMVGFDCGSNKYDGVSATTYGYFPDRGKTSAMPPQIVTSSFGDSGNGIYNKFKTIIQDRKANTMGYYGSFSYAYAERYVLNGNIRSDASNRFGQDTRHRFLPTWSLGARWNVTNEAWMQNQRVVSDLNFRGSYGWQGNVNEGFGPDLIAQVPANGSFNKQTGEYVMKIKSLPYGNLRWEKTKTVNLGTDVGFLKNRLVATVEYYRKKTVDMIVNKEVPYKFGVSTMPINGGDMVNWGWELSASATLIRNKVFSWSLSMNTAKNFNEITSKMEQNKNWKAAVQGNINKEGYAVGSMWAFEYAGLDGNGFPTFILPEESSPENLVDATTFMKYVGNVNPDFQGGISTSIAYKTFSLSASFNLQVGGKKFLTEMFNSNMYSNVPDAYYNLPKDMVDRWRKPGDEKFTDVPTIPYARKVAGLPAGGVLLPNRDKPMPHQLYNYIEPRAVDASFLRCNNIQIGYNLPSEYLKRVRLNNLSINLGVSNPFIIVSKDYKGVDPEVAMGKQPISRTYSLTFNIGL